MSKLLNEIKENLAAIVGMVAGGVIATIAGALCSGYHCGADYFRHEGPTVIVLLIVGMIIGAFIGYATYNIEKRKKDSDK